MPIKTLFKPLLLALVVAAILLAANRFLGKESPGEQTASAISEATPPPSSDQGQLPPDDTPATASAAKMIEEADASDLEEQAAAPPSATSATPPVNPVTNTAVILPGYVPLSESPVAKKWRDEEGITAEDIELAQQRVRTQGYPARFLDDPELVRSFLPRRDVVAVNVTAYSIPDRAPANLSVPFRVSGVYPDASYTFTRFEIERQQDTIRIRPIGDSSGEVMPGVEVPVDLDGSLDPLPPGTYRIEFPELGPEGQHTLVID